ncbi:hypothetical protein H7J87_28845 [Mycolicibacterium wolinskyi]|uniref:hypothetical protein n=1 Tax=Mycolicibacterium wolinskyi TaxID=59750 RepID=UPI0021F378CC|nr:hypothetical protein [Mycolicibacterium wolinskyi]MCV7289343.1 hypothetical protein [Mycolicibacterium wolinskyi]
MDAEIDDELAPGKTLLLPPWCRRVGMAAGFAALIAAVGSVVTDPGAPGVTTGASAGSSSFSLIATSEWWEPPPPAPPPPAAAPAPAPAPIRKSAA